MKIRLLIALLFMLSFSAQAQSPYKFRYSVDVPIISVGFGSALTGFILEKKRAEPTLADIQFLDRMQISTFDRSATYNWNPKAAHWSDALMYTSMATPLLFLAGKPSRSEFLHVSAISAEVFLLNTGITYLTKELVKRKRPYLYNPNAPLEKKLEKGAYQSFFSGHTSTVASMSFSFAMMHNQFYPNSRIKPLVWFAAAVLPMATAILRVRAGKHFWTDVLVGYGVGASIGVGVPLLHRIRMKG
jgi:membrane-associated phospholipid phosphatase